MFKATRSYEDQSASHHTLTFQAGDILCVLDKSNPAWWWASNQRGSVGYAMASYLKPLEEDSSQNVVLQSIDRAIAAVTNSSSSEQQEVLAKLNQHKQSVLTTISRRESSKRRAPPPPPLRAAEKTAVTQQNSTSTVTQQVSADTLAQQVSDGPMTQQSPKKQAPQPPFAASNQPTKSNSIDNDLENKSNYTPLISVQHVPTQLGQELMNKVLADCHLSELKSKEVVESLLKIIGENIPQLNEVMEEVVDTLPVIQETSDPMIEKLGLALANLKEIKEDGQQNNWAIEDDADKISSFLNEIVEGLTYGNKEDCIAEFMQNDCEYLVVLSAYHQMETRVSLRLLVLQIFGILCSLTPKIVNALMTTVLPLELVQDILAHKDDIQRVCYSALVLSMLFSTGDPIPINYYDTINTDFIHFLISDVEDESTDDERVADVFVRLLLAMNLHFIDPSKNMIVDVVAQRSCKVLGEKIMLLINRDEDPVRINEDDNVPNALMKFFQDVFSREDTAGTFLYTNDLNVLADIIARNIADLPPGAKMRTEFLDLLLNVISKSTYRENKPRGAEIVATLRRIESEDLPLGEGRDSAEFDKTIVVQIMKEHIDCLL